MTNSPTRVLGDAERNRVWRSTLTGALLRWNEGWERYSAIGGVSDWRPVRPGVISTDPIHARPREEFVQVAPEDVPA